MVDWAAEVNSIDEEMIDCCPGIFPPWPKGGWVARSEDPKDKRLTYPFICLCCGVSICPHQAAFCGHCGRCDTGACSRYYAERHHKLDPNIQYARRAWGWFEPGHGRYMALIEEHEGFYAP